MPYAAPGRADQLSAPLTDAWNATIAEVYAAQFETHGSRFVTADPDSLQDPLVRSVHWFADPAIVSSCLGSAGARAACDRPGVRNDLHDEYAEYAIVTRPDADGVPRAKRVQITTELREYWLTVATHDPDAVAAMAQDVLGTRPSFRELYGDDDPHGKTPDQRRALFIGQTAGDVDSRPPRPPRGALNRDNALFMTHPINGLDDLIFIVMFGAHPYVVETANGPRDARAGELFTGGDEQRAIACRHADPTAALAVVAMAREGRTVAFADPLGMYIRAFDEGSLSLDGEPLPASWIRRGRGQKDMHQRLEIGPPDDDPRFLDAITVSVGASEQPLTGGYQLLALTEVGPLVRFGKQTSVAEHELKRLPEVAPLDCSDGWLCDRLRAEHQAAVTG